VRVGRQALQPCHQQAQQFDGLRIVHEGIISPLGRADVHCISCRKSITVHRRPSPLAGGGLPPNGLADSPRSTPKGHEGARRGTEGDTPRVRGHGSPGPIGVFPALLGKPVLAAL
jgi:hypothetical protein